MADLFIEYFVLGFAVSIMPGAVVFETVRRTLTLRDSVLSFMLGNFIGIFLVVTCVLLGMGAILSSSQSTTVFKLLSGVVLIYLGLSSYKVNKKQINKGLGMSLTSTNNWRKSFFTGVVLAIANPVSILFWIAMIGRTDRSQQIDVLTVVIGIMLGALLAFAAIIRITQMSSRKMGVRKIWLSVRLSAIIIIGYGTIAIADVLIFS